MTTNAGSLHCPNCGAAADPSARRCPYCRARLATVSCPSCFALMFDGAAYCPHCGAARARTEAAGADLRCPACREALRRLDLGATPLLECEACDGVWVDADVFERLCADRSSQAAVLHRLGTRAVVETRGPVRYRPCLRCGKMMNRVNFGRVSGAVVDVCRSHGTFLDAGELHQIVSFIRAGGMERVRQLEIQELRDEQQRLRDAQRLGARASSGTPNAVTTSDTRALHEMLRALIGK
ncbi:MAG TPA: zf-TFIIB domain-containing protein [Vicinamibacterales bacterium]|nr:zf-TFIIB domain-containing protein [Vicinamibacterales bacterium]